MKNIMKALRSIVCTALLIFGVTACSDGSSDDTSGSFDASKLAGEWIKESDSAYTLTFSNVENGTRGYSFNVSGSINHNAVEAVSKGSNVFEGAGDDSFKLAFEGQKLKVSEATGNWVGANGLYAKPSDNGGTGGSGGSGGEPTALTVGIWVEGELPTKGSEVWYTLAVTDGTDYHIFVKELWSNSVKAGDGYADVVTSAYYDSKTGTAIFENSDAGANSNTDASSSGSYPASNFTANKDGTVYIRVSQFWNTTGKYWLVYTTTNTRPSDTAPTITTTSLTGGTVGIAYSQTLTATGDTPITWSVDSGNLPDGLNLSGATISGIPTAANTFNFTVKATNSVGSNTKALSIVIAPPVDFTPEYELGDTGPGGGKIFYISEAGFIVYQNATDTVGEICHYLEAAPDNVFPATRAWASSGSTAISITGTGTSIGTGKKNTALILNRSPAAAACRTYSSNGKTDWFLPSQDELDQLYINMTYVGNMGTSGYWSSSQYSAADAMFQDFSDGRQFYRAKGYADYSVRAVRAF